MQYIMQPICNAALAIKPSTFLGPDVGILIWDVFRTCCNLSLHHGVTDLRDNHLTCMVHTHYHVIFFHGYQASLRSSCTICRDRFRVYFKPSYRLAFICPAAVCSDPPISLLLHCYSCINNNHLCNRLLRSSSASSSAASSNGLAPYVLAACADLA